MTFSSLCGRRLALPVQAEDPRGKAGDRRQRDVRPIALRIVPGARDHRDLDRAVALGLRDLDLADGAVLIVLALHDPDRPADIGKRVGDVPGAEAGIEPRVAPAMDAAV